MKWALLSSKWPSQQVGEDEGKGSDAEDGANAAPDSQELRGVTAQNEKTSGTFRMTVKHLHNWVPREKEDSSAEQINFPNRVKVFKL